MKPIFFLFFLFFIYSNVQTALASPDEDELQKIENPARPATEKLDFHTYTLHLEEIETVTSAIEIFERTAAVLKNFAASEQDPQPSMMEFAYHQTVVGADLLRPVMDPGNAFKRFSSYRTELSEPEESLLVFQDFDSKSLEDFDIPFATNRSAQINNDEFEKKLQRARSLPTTPLAGLKIALDPGHMGGKLWDDRTGKYITDSKGNTLSEGVLNLQVAMLLRKELEILGAQVMLTRDGFNPAAKVTWEGLDIHEGGQDKLRRSQLETWFQNLLHTIPPGTAPDAVLFNAFSTNAEFKSLFAESRRWEYYVIDKDLEARAQLINDFQADIALIIHFDVAAKGSNSHGVNTARFDQTKAYVPGAFGWDELATRSSRRDFVAHLTDSDSFYASLALAKQAIGHISSEMGVALDSGGVGNRIDVEQGVMARNLNVIRQLRVPAIAYVECLFYNDPREFAAFLKRTHQDLLIEGKISPYSDRILQVVAALKHGVIDFVSTYAGPPNLP